ncbi:MAG: type II toxin-antitoxin system RelE family toxin [Bosea sp. (in: a-proteobacteria)]
MTYKLELSRQAMEFGERLPAKQQRQIAERLERLKQAPHDPPSEQLQGFAPYRRLKAGEFRIIYIVENENVLVRLIGKRNDDEIYKALTRALR